MFFSSAGDDERLINAQHFNSVYRTGDGIAGGEPCGFTIPIHHSLKNMPNVPSPLSCLSESIANDNPSFSLMMLNNYSTTLKLAGRKKEFYWIISPSSSLSLSHPSG
jgi:hypothetical protein